MCIAIRFSKFEFSDQELLRSGLDLSGDEVRVSFYSSAPLLPVHFRGKNILLPWGNKKKVGLPRTGFCKMESLEQGKWQWLHPKKAVIIAAAALTNGVWFQVRQGMEAVVVGDSVKGFYCYILTQPSTHYFKIMTGAARMPLLIGQIL